MNLQINTQNLIKTVLALSATVLLTSCGNTKSSSANNNVNIYGGQKPMARCNKTQDTNFSFNTSVVLDQGGAQSSDWIKIKFNFLSTTATASGNVIKFFKWKVTNYTTQLDSTPLAFATFDLSSGQTVSTQVNNMSASSISSNVGYYIQLNDPNVQYQVIKAVVYNSAGTVVAQVNSLIPSFYASPIDYQVNVDGTPRASILQQLHPLNSTDVTGWSYAQFQQSFDQYCF